MISVRTRHRGHVAKRDFVRRCVASSKRFAASRGGPAHQIQIERDMGRMALKARSHAREKYREALRARRLIIGLNPTVFQSCE